MRRVINFDKNYNNKLDNIMFTTIRKYTEEKRKKYNRDTGCEFNITLKDKQYTVAMLEGIVFIGKLFEIPQIELVLDTGLLSPNQNVKLFTEFEIKQDDRVIQLLFNTHWVE